MTAVDGAHRNGHTPSVQADTLAPTVSPRIRRVPIAEPIASRRQTDHTALGCAVIALAFALGFAAACFLIAPLAFGVHP